MFIEALGDAAVKHGVARADAYRMASQMIVGTGKLQLASGQHPGAMKGRRLFARRNDDRRASPNWSARASAAR